MRGIIQEAKKMDHTLYSTKLPKTFKNVNFLQLIKHMHFKHGFKIRGASQHFCGLAHTGSWAFSYYSRSLSMACSSHA